MARKKQPAEGTTFRDENLNSRQKALLAAKEVDGLKARDIVILDVRSFPALAEYFVICSGDTKRLLDLNNVVVHLFDPQTREFYELERLWGDAPQVPFDPAAA